MPIVMLVEIICNSIISNVVNDMSLYFDDFFFSFGNSMHYSDYTFYAFVIP